MKIIIETIPHEKQAYETVGNYTEKEGYLHIEVSELGDDRYNLLVALHELVEYHLCKHCDIKDSDIVAFDKEYEAKRPEGNKDEPGFDDNAPYRKEHTFATGIEMAMASQLDVNWNKYGEMVMSL